MKLSVKVAAMAALIAALAEAACPNGCSRNGICVGNDKCECFPAWTGADCSTRACRFGPAWVTNAADPHSYTECSSQGYCDRTTGECNCFDGFTGIACSRDLQDELVVRYDELSWDYSRLETCLCDPGFFGSDCSQRYCPTGDDPLTLCTSTKKSHVQTITFNMGSAHASDGSSDEKMALFGTSSATNFAAAQGTSAAGQLRVTYTDSLGGQYVAHAVSGVLSSDPTVSRNSLEVALETLPDQKVTDVKVVSSLTGSATTDLIRTLTVTFLADATNSNNVGMQPLLQCDSGYSCTEQGCFPMVKMPFLYRYAAIAEGNIGSTFATGNLAFYSGTDNGNANVVRLAATSQPQMPAGIAVDTGYDNAHLYRYDMRIVVAVVGGASADVADKYYTRVIAGHDNINSASEAMFGIQGVLPTSVSGLPTRSINTMTYQGPIPNPFSEVPVAGAPGVLLQFPSRKWVADGQVQFSEILIKLPFCSVTADASSVDVNVENVECGSRGQCNRETGACNCFPGYTGVACQMQTVMV